MSTALAGLSQGLETCVGQCWSVHPGKAGGGTYSWKHRKVWGVLQNRCTNKAWVQQRMIKENLFVDLVGVTGKKLLTQRDLSKRGPSRGAALLRDLIG
ncbi:hypothetical protein CVIRNUC_010194 [Coccomyxa viridis]|uniref:Ribosomal protein L28 n=1 Tax=Coccomyxa viridis TaxID=1274662 RepID=A0AAV1II09_9CHLO|nr:hypothetical protein CVIRNUC_010194 [Coccomyxa viridis]